MFLVKSNNHRYGWPVSFEKYLNRELSSLFGSDVQSQVPGVNVREDESAFHLEVAAPGLKKEDFQVSVDKNVLSISAEVKTENKEEKPSYLKKEFSYHSFKRSFTLPETANAEAISARYENGVLHVVLPKKEKATAPGVKNITIA